MKIEVINLGGVVKSTLDTHEKITLISGRNGSGKTSQLVPVMQALSGAFPVPAAAKEMIRSGHSSGLLRISDGEKGYEVSYPECKPVSQGWPAAGIYASGLVKFAEEKTTTISEYLQKLLKTEPTINDLAKALKERGIISGMSAEEAKTYTNAVWSNIQRKNWVGAHKDYQERGRQLKAEWKATTGETYGEKKGAIWCPDGWEDELNAKSEETLRAELSEQEALLEALLKVEAVAESEIERLEEESAGISETAKKRDEAIWTSDKLEDEFQVMTDRYKRLPRPAAQVETFPCPHCSEPIDKRTHGKPPAGQTKEEITAIEKTLSEEKEKLDELETQFKLAQNSALALRSEFYTKSNAKEKLDSLKKKASQQRPTEETIDQQRRAVEAAKVRLNAFTQKKKADAAHIGVEKNQLLIDLLEPDGWRQSFSTEALRRLNEDYLRPQCELVGCPEVSIGRSLTITWDGRGYKQCSTGEKWLVNALFQIALGRLEEADLLVFDEAGVLDPQYAQGFFALLSSLEIPSLVAMTRGRSRVPNVGRMGIGVAYWTEAHTTELIEEAVPA